MQGLPDGEMAALEAALGLKRTRTPPSPAPLMETSTDGPTQAFADSPRLRRSPDSDHVLQDDGLESDVELDHLVAEALSLLPISSLDHDEEDVRARTDAAVAEAARPARYKRLLPASQRPPEPNSSISDTAEETHSCKHQHRVTQTTSTKNGKAPRRPKVNANRARNERRLELAYLRAKVKTLESDLQTLHRRHSTNTHLTTSARSPDAPNPGPTIHASTEQSPVSPELSRVWEDLAHRQLERREKAERENTQLKLVLESQIKMAKSMEELLQKRIERQLAGSAGLLQGADPGPHPPQGRALDVLMDEASFEALIQGVDMAYSELDAVLATNGLDRDERPCREAHMREGGSSGMYLDIFASKLLPFAFESTAAAVWSHFQGMEKHRGKLYMKTSKTLETSGDTVIEELMMEFVGDRKRADFRLKQVLRRYASPEREVVVWVSNTKAADPTRSSPFSSFGFSDKGYVISKRPVDPALRQQGFTLLQMCVLVLPNMVESRLLDRAAVGSFTEFMLNVVAANIRTSQDMIENVLLDQTIRQ